MKSLTAYLVFFLACFPFLGMAQQDAQFTQYMYNTSSINPAYAGSRGVTSFSGLHRQQWVNVEGTPTTQTLTFDAAVDRKNRIGLGFSVINDRIKPTSETHLNIDFSYAIALGGNKKLRFGTKIVGHLLNVDLVNLSRDEINDVAYQNDVRNKFDPNLGLGLYYHTKRFYIGLSVPNILETNYFDQEALSGLSASSILAQERINYYLIAGHTFDLNSNLKFKPALMTKMLYGAPLQVDMSANFLLFERLTLGAAYRWSAAVSAIAGFQIFKGLMVGVAFDHETTELSKTQFNNGSYEFLIRFDLLNKISRNSNRMLTPRFF